MLFIAHGLPKTLKVDEIVHLGIQAPTAGQTAQDRTPGSIAEAIDIKVG